MSKNVVHYMQVNTCMSSGVHPMLAGPALPRRPQKAASIAGNPDKSCFTQSPFVPYPVRDMKFPRLVFLFCLFCSSSAWSETAPIGYVKNVSGEAFITSGTSRIRAVPNSPVHLGSLIRTAPKSSVGMAFNDATLLSVGSDTELVLDEYVYQPKSAEFKFGGRMVKGTLDYVSGAIAKSRPESVNIKTPAGVLGVRGTQLLALVESLRSRVILIADPDGKVGKVLVQGSRGVQIIDQENFGAPIDGSEAPTLVSNASIQSDFGEAMSARPVPVGAAQNSSSSSTASGTATAGSAANIGAGNAVAASIGGLSLPAVAIGGLAIGAIVTTLSDGAGASGTTGTR